MRTSHRGYGLIVVMIGLIVTAALSTALLTTAVRDRTEARLQANAVRAMYAAEASVVWGIAQVGELIRDSGAPTPAQLDAILPPTIPNVQFPASGYQIDFVDPANNFTPIATPDITIKALDSGAFAGMNAQQVPIQVLSTARFKTSVATISDVLRVELIPVSQFAIFMDGPIEYFLPEPSTVSGRAHSNEGFFFGDGARDVEFVTSTVTTAGRIHLREIGGTTSTEGSRTPTINGTVLQCDNAKTNRDVCPGGKSWISYTLQDIAGVRDIAHGVPQLHLPTGVSASSFNEKVFSTPDICGEDSTGQVVAGSGKGRKLSPDWLLIDTPKAGDDGALRNVKYGHLAGIRALDGVWTRNGIGWFRQDDPSTPETQCVYYGYDPTSDEGRRISRSDGVPAIRDVRFWDYQDRRLRRVQIVDLHRLTRCLPDLNSSTFNGILYIGETMNAPTDNWGLDPDDAFYETNAGGACNPKFLNLPHYLRGQLSDTVFGSINPDMPDFLENDNVARAGGPVLDNPYYVAGNNAFCAPTGTRKRALGDGVYRLPQGNGNNVREPGRNELVEGGVLLRNAERVPNVMIDGKPRGFTLATNGPLYLQGDLNVKVGAFDPSSAAYTAGKVPVSVAGDSVTFLSNKFNDLQENPFAPVGPLAVWQAVHGAAGGALVGNQQDNSPAATNRRWSSLALADANGAPVTGAARFDTDRSNASATPGDFRPASPAPCVNLLRELALRRPIAGVDADDKKPANACGGNCGQGGLTKIGDGGATLAFSGIDWFKDLSDTPAILRDRATTSTVALDDGDATHTYDEWLRLQNAFVAFAPLERFLDTSMYQNADSATAGFSNRSDFPTTRNNREALRDWMRCTLNSQHHLGDNDAVLAVTYNGSAIPGVIIGKQPQTASITDHQRGMRKGTGANDAPFDVSFVNVIGADGFAPLSTDSVFRGDGRALFSRDRSSLSDPNGTRSPVVMQDAGTFKTAAAGDQLALNAAIISGTTWRCPNEMPFPTKNSTHNVINDGLPSGSKDGGAFGWKVASLDEGVYGIFRYQESWFELDRGSTSFSAGKYIDFFVNGSVVVMFYSRESPGRHLINQGFNPNMFDTGNCGGQDNNQKRNRECRTNPAFEYAWESSRRSIRYDPDLDDPDNIPPGTPMVLNSTRLRWVRR